MKNIGKNYAGKKGRLLYLTDIIYKALPYELRRKLFALFFPSKFNSLQERKQKIIDGMESYKPFMDTKSIFFHIPKTAGISVSSPLYGNISGNHASIRKYQLVFSEDEFNRYYKFAFVRNPWDRIFSAYNFLKKGGFNRNDALWAEKHLQKYFDFNEFIMDWLKLENIWQYRHFVPQYWYVCDLLTTDVKVDFIARFESIEQDFQVIVNQLFPGKKVILEHSNKTHVIKKAAYIEAYSDVAKERVANVYKTDIELFSYKFS